MNFLHEMENYIDLINETLRQYLKADTKENFANTIFDAMEYSLLPGGKRIRPLILLGVCESLGGEIKVALPFACAIEMIHTYSLIHDDLPAVDNSDLRHGKPSCHVQFEEAYAILAGDALLNLAFEVMAESCLKSLKKSSISAMREIAVAAGVHGMIGGQTADIKYENKAADENVLSYIHTNKTSKLISAAATAGAFLASDNKNIDIEAFRRAGESLGLAFQIRDDILDVTSNSQTLGKPVLSDGANKKNTYVSVFGLDKAENDYKSHSEKAVKDFENLCGPERFILYLVKNISTRRH